MNSLQKSDQQEAQVLTLQNSKKPITELIRTNKDITLVESTITFDSATKATHLRDAVKEEGKKAVVASLVSLMVRLQHLVNTTRKLTEEQIMVIAMDLIDVYPHESVEDFALMFKMARQNRFSASYGTLDSPTIHKWMVEYLDKKAEDRENKAKQSAMDDMRENKSPSPILEKILQETKPKQFRVISPDITFERHIAYLKALIPDLDRVNDNYTLVNLKKDLSNNNSLSGVYDEVIEMVENKLAV